MNYSRVEIVKAVVDLGYTALALGLVAYALRGEIRLAIARRRDEFEVKHREIAERIERERKGREYLAVIRDAIIDEEHREDGPLLGMEP